MTAEQGDRPYRSTITQAPAAVIDYKRYIVEEPVNSAQFETDPRSWWKLNKPRFPAPLCYSCGLPLDPLVIK